MTERVRIMSGLAGSRLHRPFGQMEEFGSGVWVSRTRLTVVVCVVVACGVLGLGVGSAGAARVFPFDGQLVPGSGEFGLVEGNSVAVVDGSGDAYVADSASGVVDVLATASGSEVSSWNGSAAVNPPGAPAGSFGGGKVAVAASDGTGDVYVLDSTNSVVDVLNAAGAYVCQITGRAVPSGSECDAGGSATPAGGFAAPGGIAVDQATGEVYVLDANNGVVDVFSVAGAYLRQISLASIPGGFNAQFTRGIAVSDFNGDVYVSDSGHDIVYVFDAAGAWTATWTGANTPAGSFGHGYVSVAADDTSGLVYVSDSQHGVVDVFEPSGAYATQLSVSVNDPLGVAVDQGTGRVYVSNNQPGVLGVFGPSVVIPDVATGGASGARPTSATLNGTVNPDGLLVTSCEFEYGPEASYGQSMPCAQSLGSGSGPVAVSAELSGLPEGATYHYRLVASNANGPNQGADAEVTLPSLPSVDSASTENLLPGSVDLHAAINPHSAETSYRFEYGTSTAYGSSIPVSDGVIPSGQADRTVVEHVTGLQPNTTYHWRVVAHNIAGTTTGSDHTFVYEAAGAGLPDGRQYEMITPPHKNGALLGDYYNFAPTVFSEDGRRVIITSIQCFAGASSCTASREFEGEPYEFTRTGGGWVTTPMAPSAGAGTGESNTEWLASADGGTALFAVPTAPVGEDDFYARQADGSFVHVGPITSPSQDFVGDVAFEYFDLVATADLSHVVYGQSVKVGFWPFDATERGPSLYEYAGDGSAAPQLVGVSGGPGSTDLISTCGTVLGGDDTGAATVTRDGSLSADGGTVFFTASACGSGSGANAGVAVPADTLYARIDGARTVRISSGGAATFMGASTDGSKVFFLEGGELYEYDFANPTGHNLVAVGGGVLGVAAVSADGSHVYFVSNEALSATPNSQGQSAQAGANNLYVFERDAAFPNGRLAFVATLPASDEEVWRRVIAGETAEEAGNEALSAEEANVTPDGRFLVFTSHGALTANDTSTTGMLQVFRYDAQTGELARVSIGEHGFNDNGNIGRGNASILLPAEYSHTSPWRRDPTMSNDGSYVFFESPLALTPGAVDDVQIASNLGGAVYAKNLYEYHDGNVYLISDGKDVAQAGQDRSAVKLIGSDGSGANVFFSTADPLVAQDTDTQVDYYDARICTASEPCPAASPAPVACQGEACHGTPPAAPSLLAPVSASFNGVGNQSPPVAAPVVKAKKKTKPTRRAHIKKRKSRHVKKARKVGRAGKSVKRGRK
jgi:hypothetical protein